LTARRWAPWVWALIVAVVLGHCGYLWRQQRFVPDTDILALLPAADRDAVRQRALAQMVETARQKVVVLIGAADWEAARRGAAAYRQILAPRRDLIDDADSMTEGIESDWLTAFQRHRLVLITAEDDAALRTQTQQVWLDTALAKLYSPFAGAHLAPWQEDPFNWFGNWLQARAQETPVRPRGGVLSVSANERHYVVLLLTSRLPAFAVAGQQAIVPVLEQARRAALDAAPGVEVIQGGVMLHAAAAAGQARQEMAIIGIGSLAGVLLLVWLTFNSLKPIVYVMLAIGVGCLGALWLSTLLFGRLHLLTLVFGASLIGVAEDYGIYFFCRRLGADARLDSWELLGRTLPALLLTLATTLIGYLGLFLTPFPGLRQMALFSASGLIFAWLTVVFWFPALVRPDTLRNRALVQRSSFSLSRWPCWRDNRRQRVALLILAAVIVYGALRLSVQDDIRTLHNSPKELIDDQIKLGEILDLAAPGQFFLLRAASVEVLLQREESLRRRLDQLVEQKQLSGYHAISNWVPSAKLQQSRRQAIERVILSKDGALALLAVRLGADQNWLTATRSRLLGAAAPITSEEFLHAPASRPWRHLWLGQMGAEHASMVALRGVSKRNLPALRLAAAGLEGVEWVDQVGEISTLLGTYRRYMGWVISLAYLAIYALLYRRYGRHSWRVLAPTALASLLALAFLGISGQALQLFHLLALMLLLGIGVDYGIFMQEPDSQKDGAAWLAVGVSALSTLLSFGLLALSQTPALRAFGLILAIGIGAVTLLVPYFRSVAAPPAPGR
jgi:predicted exporter